MATLLTKPFEGPQAKKVPGSRPTVPGFLPFGANDLFPQDLKDAIDDSDTATAAIQARAEFIIGNGLFNEQLAELVVNRQRQTLDDVVDGIGWNVAEGEVVTIAVAYNGLGKVAGFKSVPWETVRLVEPDEKGVITHAGIFPNLGMPKGKKDLSKEFTLLPLYNPDPQVVLQEMSAVGGIQNYYGQLVYIKAGKPQPSYYQIPSLYGSSKNLETEKELTDYDFATAVNGFNTPGMIKVLKKNKTKKDEEEDEDGLDAQVKANQGGENAGNPLIFEAETPEELAAMGFVSMTGPNLADRYNSTSERVMQRIARRTRVPNEMINIRKAGGIAPTGDEMRVASQVMQQSVNKVQRIIERVLDSLFDNWHEPLPVKEFGLKNLNYFSDAGAAQPGQPTNMAQ